MIISENLEGAVELEGIADLRHVLVIAGDERLNVGCDELSIRFKIGCVRHRRLIEVRPMLPQAAHDVGSRLIAADGFPDHQRCRILLLLVPIYFLFSPRFVLFHGAVLGRLEFQRC